MRPISSTVKRLSSTAAPWRFGQPARPAAVTVLSTRLILCCHTNSAPMYLSRSKSVTLPTCWLKSGQGHQGGKRQHVQSEPSRHESMPWKHVAAVTVGNALEFYDFVTYAFF